MLFSKINVKKIIYGWIIWNHTLSCVLTTRKLSSCNWFFGRKMAKSVTKTICDRFCMSYIGRLQIFLWPILGNLMMPLIWSQIYNWKIGCKFQFGFPSTQYFPSQIQSVANFKEKKRKKKNHNLMKFKFHTPGFNNSPEMCIQ